MNSEGQVLLLVGSAKRPRSTSQSLGTYLLGRLRDRGFRTETLLIHRSLSSDEGRQQLLTATDRADVLILAFPLFIDSLPAPVIEALQLLARHQQAAEGTTQQRLLTIVNSGFPEAHHMDTAIAICRRFAREAGLEWAGGLALGAGEVVGGRPLSQMGPMVRNVTRSLDLTAIALAEGRPVQQEAVELMTRKLLPIWGYLLVAPLTWLWRARKHRALGRMGDRPYQKAGPHPLEGR